MENILRLHLVFRTSKGMPYTITIDNPRAMLPAMIIRQTMQTIIDVGLFEGEQGKLVDLISAYYTEVEQRGIAVKII